MFEELCLVMLVEQIVSVTKALATRTVSVSLGSAGNQFSVIIRTIRALLRSLYPARGMVK